MPGLRCHLAGGRPRFRFDWTTQALQGQGSHASPYSAGISRKPQRWLNPPFCDGRHSRTTIGSLRWRGTGSHNRR
jgi:hypothetical protein